MINIKTFFLHVYSDLCTAFGASMLPLVDKEPITGLITKGRRGKASKSRTLATWATKEIRKLKNASWYVTYDADSLPSLTNSRTVYTVKPVCGHLY